MILSSAAVTLPQRKYIPVTSQPAPNLLTGLILTVSKRGGRCTIHYHLILFGQNAKLSLDIGV
jgi:quercetin dioxygenase-like cupin family protein